MMHLMMDGTDKGPVVYYEQDRSSKRWHFLMDGGETVKISFNAIKRFDIVGANLNVLTLTWTIDMIEKISESDAQSMAMEHLEIKGHDVYLVDFGGCFGYSALVFADGMPIYYANDYALHHSKSSGESELRALYVKGLNGKLFTEEEIAGPIENYGDYDRKSYFLHNYYGMRKPYVSIFGNFNDKNQVTAYEKKRQTFTHYNEIAFAYYEDEAFVDHHRELFRRLEQSLAKMNDSFDYWVGAFKHEMYNHEYAINGQADYDTLSAFGNLHWANDLYRGHEPTLENYFDQLHFNGTQRKAYAEAMRQYNAEQRD